MHDAQLTRHGHEYTLTTMSKKRHVIENFTRENTEWQCYVSLPEGVSHADFTIKDANIMLFVSNQIICDDGAHHASEIDLHHDEVICR